MSDDPDDTRTVDVLAYHDGDSVTHRLVPAGKGDDVVQAHEEERRKRQYMRGVLAVLIAGAVLSYGLFVGSTWVGVVAAAAVLGAFWVGGDDAEETVPEVVDQGRYPRNAAELYDTGEGALEQAETDVFDSDEGRP